jgi:type II secretory pathway pseudopilin PulG
MPFRSSGFSLLDMMTSLVLVGILAMVSVPSYKEYIKQAKMAEAYLVIEGLNTANVSFFADKGFFPPRFVIGGDNEGDLLIDGAKHPVTFFGGYEGMSDGHAAKDMWQEFHRTVSTIITPSTHSYFNFRTDSGSFTSTGTYRHVLVNYNPGTQKASLMWQDTGIYGGLGPFFHTNDGRHHCVKNMTFSEMGVPNLRNPSTHFSFTYAGASMEPEKCNIIFQSVIASNGKISRTPMVTLSLNVTESEELGSSSSTTGVFTSSSGSEDGRDTRDSVGESSSEDGIDTRGETSSESSGEDTRGESSSGEDTKGESTSDSRDSK